MGVFGGYTRWAVVFLIIFVLFFLLCPAYGYGVVPTAGTHVAVTTYGKPYMGHFDSPPNGMMHHDFGSSPSSV